MAAMIRSAWVDAPGSLGIVHGGGDEVSALQRAMGRQATFIGGRRVTSKADLALLRMVLSGAVNKRLVNAFITAGVPAVGISGEDAALLESEIIDAEALGFAGQPRRINATLLKTLLAGGYMPVISPVGYDATSGGWNAERQRRRCRSCDRSCTGADELLFVADVEGVHNDRGEAFQYLTLDQAKELISSGTAAGGMAAKLESANAAMSSGNERVRVAAVQGIGNPNCGTFITQAEGIAS